MLNYALSLQDDAVLSTNQENQLINNFDSAAPSVPHSSGACFDSATLSGSSSVVPSDSAAPLLYPTGNSTGISGFTGTGWGIGAQLSLPSFDPSVPIATTSDYLTDVRVARDRTFNAPTLQPVPYGFNPPLYPPSPSPDVKLLTYTRPGCSQRDAWCPV